MNRLLAQAIAALSVLWAAMAVAAGPFDGVWSGGADVPQGSKCGLTYTTINIADGNAAGTTERRVGDLAISGTVQPDGSLEGTVGRAHLTGQFSGDQFSGSYNSTDCGRRNVSRSRKR